jgi:hypothetical protein
VRENDGKKQKPYAKPTLTVYEKLGEPQSAPVVTTANVKKKYTKPKFTVYGKVSELTSAVGNFGPKDGGTGKFQKSQ